jgi:uncharacterized protein
MMLASFRFRNYRSFLNEQEFSLWSDAPKRPSGNGRGREPLTVAAIYGANASGKSNLLRAMAFGRSAVLRSYRNWDPDGGVPGYAPFLLAAGSPQLPTTIEFELLAEETRYQYGFECTASSFTREWLYTYPQGKRQTLFERDSAATEPWYFGRRFAGPNRLVASTTRDNSLFLSAAASAGHQGTRPVFEWFSRHLPGVVGPQDRQERMVASLATLNEAEHRNRIGQLRSLLRAADLGIVDAKVRQRELSELERERLVRVLRAMADSDEDARVEDAIRESVDLASRYIEFAHSADDGTTVPLPVGAESYGTMSLVALAGPVFVALEDGDTLLIDELDASLHPQLVASIVELFLNPVSNPNRAQLIFTTHDTTLLGNLSGKARPLDRALVWFTEKDKAGSSSLFPLTDFSPRRDENLERGYLQGRFGAVPVITQSLAEVIASPATTTDLTE